MTVGKANATTRVRVRYAETDRMGVVYYANYLVWFEVGRTELLRTLGWSYREMEQAGIGLTTGPRGTMTSWKSERRERW